MSTTPGSASLGPRRPLPLETFYFPACVSLSSGGNTGFWTPNKPTGFSSRLPTELYIKLASLGRRCAFSFGFGSVFTQDSLRQVFTNLVCCLPSRRKIHLKPNTVS